MNGICEDELCPQFVYVFDGLIGVEACKKKSDNVIENLMVSTIKPLHFLAHWHSMYGGLCSKLLLELANRWRLPHVAARSFVVPVLDHETFLPPAWTTPQCEAQAFQCFVLSWIIK